MLFTVAAKLGGDILEWPMSIRNALKDRNWSIYAIYEQFEQIVSRSLLLLISVIIVYSLSWLQ
jgi:hypothetical protein